MKHQTEPGALATGKRCTRSLTLEALIAKSKTSPGFTLVELLVVLAIIALLAALLMVGIQKSRQVAALTDSSNNLRQIGLALQNCHTQMGSFPPGFGYFPGGPADPSLAGGS